MPEGPRGQKRPADVVGAAIKVARISVGDEEEDLKQPTGRTRSGQAGAKARNSKLTPEDRRKIAKKAAAARWK
jgi:hypothetical protein